ncbi:MAG: hypothetical protein KatS3mg015_0512 [Fimbriimonadales bacterium]|nr:MAG: hypothetical protein KatS3mg015_0512 [Fimbriimonadales bacterium]
MVAVRYSSGGFIKKCCTTCYEHIPLGYMEFESLPMQFRCPKCGRIAKYDTYWKNYAVLCDHCQVYLWLADLIITYEQLREHLIRSL